MPLPVITSAFAHAGVRLLNTLIDRALEYDDQTDDPVYLIIEHWAREVQSAADLPEIFNAAQDEFTSHESPHARAQSRWLEAVAVLFEFGGEDVPAFVANLWRAYFFRLGNTADLLWQLYPELRHSVAIRTDRQLPASWGDWILPMQTFMGIAESSLIDSVPEFENLITSQDVIDLLEEMEPVHQPSDPFETRGATFVPDPHFDATATLLAYLVAFTEHVGQVDPRGLPQVNRTAVPLDGIYTPLLLSPISALDGPKDFSRYQTAASLETRPHLSYEPVSRADLENQPGLMAQEALYQSPQALILGEVGGGKTTLLRYLGMEAARGLLDEQQSSFQVEHDADGGTRIALNRPLPIFVNLAEYVDTRSPDEDLQSYILRCTAEMVGDQGVVPMLVRFLDAGQCLLLLDGLDQAATDEQRRMLTENVGHAAAHWRVRGNRIAVTSRMAGYGAAPLADTFTGYIIRPLDRSQIGPFLLRWSLALVRLRRPLMRDDEALQQAQAETLALVREVTTNPQLAALAANPLMLRLLVGIFRPGTLVVPQRVAVYQMVADGLIHDWRLPQSAANPPVILEQEATNLMAHLAYWIHAARPAGRLTEAELRKILAEIWRQLHPDNTADQVDRTLEEFIGRLNPHSGPLVELYPGEFGFVYAGLQEYFAARYLVSSYRLAPERIRNFLHDPRWDEIIRLAIGFTALRSQEDASDLIETGVLARGTRAAELGHRPSPYESLLRRDLFFAARLLGAGSEARPAITNEVVRDLMTLWLNGDRDSTGRYSLIFDAARRHLTQLDGTMAGRRAMQMAVDALADPDEHRRAYAADAATFWPSTLGEGADPLVKAARDTTTLVRQAVAQALGRVGELPAEAYRLLLGLVNDTDEAVAVAARATLHTAQPVPQDTLSMFVDLLHGGTLAGRRVALRQLQQVGALPPGVVGELIHLLNDPEPDIRQGAMDALASATHLPDNALMTICRLAMDTTTGLRLSAVNALRRPVELPNEVIVHLVDWTYDPEMAIRRAAALALGECLNKAPDVMDALVERLDDPIDTVRADVVDSMARKGHTDTRIMHVLAHAVRDPIHRVRGAVASALRHFPEPGDELRAALRLLLNDKEVIVREAALETIAGLKTPGMELIDEVVALVRVQDFGIGSHAVRALARQRNLPQPALVALIGALPVHWEAEGQAIGECLRAHYPLGMDLINRIMDLAVSRPVGLTQAGRSPDGLRALALEILGHELDEAPDIVSVLVEAASDSTSPDVQVAALRGLAHSKTLWPEVKDILLARLAEGALPVRCAAGIALGRLMHSLPDPPLSAEEMTRLADMLAALLKEITPRAAWENGAQTQNALLRALSQVVTRSKPSAPRLPAHAEMGR